MQLDNITVSIRPRNAWEAIDLGFALVRNWWKSVYSAWFLITIPVFVALQAAFWQHLWLAGLIFWWLKPLYDRIVLHIISRALFGDPPNIHETLRALPRLLTKSGLVTNLTLLRLSPTRSFNLPVWQLEMPRGRSLRTRLHILRQQIRPHAVWLTLTCVHLEFVLEITGVGIAVLLLPEQYDLLLWEQFISSEAAVWFQLWTNLAYFFAISIMEPQYVAAGFMLYINRRTQLEGWDIELVFRSMAQRLAGKFH